MSLEQIVSTLATASQDLHTKKNAHAAAVAAWTAAVQATGLAPVRGRHRHLPVPPPDSPPDFNALAAAVAAAKAAVDASQAAYDSALAAHREALSGAGVNPTP